MPLEPWAATKKSFIILVVWRWHQLLFDSLSKGRLSRVSHRLGRKLFRPPSYIDHLLNWKMIPDHVHKELFLKQICWNLVCCHEVGLSSLLFSHVVSNNNIENSQPLLINCWIIKNLSTHDLPSLNPLWFSSSFPVHSFCNSLLNHMLKVPFTLILL